MLDIVADVLARRGTRGWLVGGSVRDLMRDRYSPDLDVAVADDASAVAKQVAAALGAPCFRLSERYPAYRVLGKRGYVDMTAVRGDILSDLSQRDFTVNAMAVPVDAVHARKDGDTDLPLEFDLEALVDPHGGAAHLAQGRLVAVSAGIFADDPLRLMRAVRFQHAHGLRLDGRLARKVRAEAALLGGAAAERVVREVCLTLEAGRSSAAVRSWADLGLLTVFLPEVAGASRWRLRTRGFHRAVARRMERLDEVLLQPGDRFPKAVGLLEERLALAVDGTAERPAALRLAALLCGLSVDQVREVGRRLKLSGALISLLSAASRCLAGRRGPRPLNKTTSAAGRSGRLRRGPSRRDDVLFLWDAHPWEPEVILLAAACEDKRVWTEAQRLLESHMGRMADARPLPVDGEVLMGELGLEAGPLLGRALRVARLAWEAGEATTRDEVLSAARQAVEG